MALKFLKKWKSKLIMTFREYSWRLYNVLYAKRKTPPPPKKKKKKKKKMKNGLPLLNPVNTDQLIKEQNIE